MHNSLNIQQQCLYIFDLTGSYCMLQVRCLVDVPGDKLPSVASGALAAYLKETTAPQVPEQLRAAFLAAIDAGRLRSMLNKQMTLTPLHRPGALLLGDAFNMRYASAVLMSVEIY